MMASHDMNPEIVVGIDFGMTCTGAAYSSGPDWRYPRTIQRWPGRMINELANKVPTLLAYHDGGGQIASWGFRCDPDNETTDLKEYFKLHLDPQYSDENPDAPNVQEARLWYGDYLKCIHDYVIEFLSNSIPHFTSRRVDFLFSIPTTWKDASMIKEIERIIRSAGFGKDGDFHRVEISLTEAEAAAIYAKKEYKRDDVILVCDAGGGTTDVNVLKLVSSSGEATRLQQLNWVEGRAIGSALIDMRIHKILEKRLQQLRNSAGSLQIEPREVAHTIMRGRFERFKCAFGSDLSSEIHALPLQVPGLPPGTDFPAAGIYNSKIIITREEVQKAFDEQVQEMCDLLDESIEKLQKIHPREQIVEFPFRGADSMLRVFKSFLVLSGGFGSSPYVRERLVKRYKDAKGHNWSSVEDMKVLHVDEPQLSVVHGLVLERTQAITRSEPVFGSRCCPVSYGMVCRQLYDPAHHIGEHVELDRCDRRKWATNQIDWFIRQGETISSSGLAKPYEMKIPPYDQNRRWKVEIVMSHLPCAQLPRSLRHGGAKTVCTVESTLENVEKKLKNRHWYNRGKKYFRARFNVVILLRAADLKFQLRSRNSGNAVLAEQPIDVKWDPPMEKSSGRQGEPDGGDVYPGVWQSYES